MEVLTGHICHMHLALLQLRWELGSPLFGLLLRRYAPDDTYTLRKVGVRVRGTCGTKPAPPYRARALLVMPWGAKGCLWAAGL